MHEKKTKQTELMRNVQNEYRIYEKKNNSETTETQELAKPLT